MDNNLLLSALPLSIVFQVSHVFAIGLDFTPYHCLSVFPHPHPSLLTTHSTMTPMPMSMPHGVPDVMYVLVWCASSMDRPSRRSTPSTCSARRGPLPRWTTRSRPGPAAPQNTSATASKSPRCQSGAVSASRQWHRPRNCAGGGVGSAKPLFNLLSHNAQPGSLTLVTFQCRVVSVM